MRDLSTARILLTGILAPIFELTKEKCEIDLQTISIALDDRMSKGLSLVYEQLWKPSKDASGFENRTSNRRVFQKFSLGPATKDEIHEAN